MWQLVVAYISVHGWANDSDENGFFDGSCNVLVFSMHNAKIAGEFSRTQA